MYGISTIVIPLVEPLDTVIIRMSDWHGGSVQWADLEQRLRDQDDFQISDLEETWPRAGALNRLRAARDPDLESVRPALVAKGLLA